MKFEFAKYTEITDFAFETNPNYKNDGYVRFFICPDVWDYWFVRILKDTNEKYETEEGCFLLERNQVPMDSKGENLSINKLRKIIQEDDGCNWDIQQSYDIDRLIEIIDGGFGINNLKETEPDEKYLIYMSDDMYLPIHYKGVKVEQPFYSGDGNHSVHELQNICKQYKEYVHQQQVIKQNCMKHIVQLKFGINLEKQD